MLIRVYAIPVIIFNTENESLLAVKKSIVPYNTVNDMARNLLTIFISITFRCPHSIGLVTGFNTARYLHKVDTLSLYINMCAFTHLFSDKGT